VLSDGVLGLLVIGLIIGALCACAVTAVITRARDRQAWQEWDDLVAQHWQLDRELEEIWQQR
jgi:cell division protein FtsL